MHASTTRQFSSTAAAVQQNSNTNTRPIRKNRELRKLTIALDKLIVANKHDDALKLFWQANVEPDTHTVTQVLRACQHKPDMAARVFRHYVASRRVPSDEPLAAVCLAVDARTIDTTLERLKFFWDAGCVHDVAICAVLRQCASHGNSMHKHAVAVYADAEKRGMTPTVLTANALLSVYAHDLSQSVRAGETAFREQFSGRGIAPDAETLRTMIFLCSSRGDLQAAERYFAKFAELGLAPSMDAFTELIAGRAQARDFPGAKRWFDRIAGANLRPSIHCVRQLLKACTRDASSSLSDAERIFALCEDDLNLRPTDTMLSAMITFCDDASGDNLRVAATYFDKFARYGYRPFLTTFKHMIFLCARAEDYPRALEYFRGIGAAGLEPDVRCFNALLLATRRDPRCAPETTDFVFSRLVDAGLTPNS